MVVALLLAVAVALAALPALALGGRGLTRYSGHYSEAAGADRVSLVLIVLLRLVALLVLLATAGLTLVSTVGAAIQEVELHGFVYVFFVFTMLLAALVLFTFGRPAPRRAHRRANPARR